MLEIATTRSMTNSMKVPDCSSPPTEWMRIKVHAMPKNRSSRMKRSRQERRLVVARRFFEKLPAGADDHEMDDQRAAGPHPGGERSGPQAGKSPMVTTRSRIASDPDRRFCANWRSSS